MGEPIPARPAWSVYDATCEGQFGFSQPYLISASDLHLSRPGSGGRTTPLSAAAAAETISSAFRYCRCHSAPQSLVPARFVATAPKRPRRSQGCRSPQTKGGFCQWLGTPREDY